MPPRALNHGCTSSSMLLLDTPGTGDNYLHAPANVNAEPASFPARRGGCASALFPEPANRSEGRAWSRTWLATTGRHRTGAVRFWRRSGVAERLRRLPPGTTARFGPGRNLAYRRRRGHPVIWSHPVRPPKRFVHCSQLPYSGESRAVRAAALRLKLQQFRTKFARQESRNKPAPSQVLSRQNQLRPSKGRALAEETRSIFSSPSAARLFTFRPSRQFHPQRLLRNHARVVSAGVTSQLSILPNPGPLKSSFFVERHTAPS